MKSSRRTWLAASLALAQTTLAGLAMSPEADDSRDGGVVQGAPSNTGELAKTAMELHDLSDIQQLSEAFNAAKGSPRIILLFSPS